MIEPLEPRRLLHHALFLAPTRFDTGPETDAIAVADLNHDGRLDILEVDGDTENMNVYLSARRGRYARQTYSLGMENLSSIAVGDFNRDGFLDVAVVGTQLAILFGTANGLFNPTPAYITVGNTPQTVITGNFNNDKWPDLAVTNILDDTVSILTGRGRGHFNVATVPGGAGPSGITAADLNGDGKVDLAVANAGEQATGSGAGITLLIGKGDGTFTAGGSLNTVGRPFQIVAADLNKDGSPDLITADGGINSPTGANDISVLMSGRRHRFLPAVQYASQGDTPEGVAVGDINGDGNLDVVSSNFNGNGGGDLGLFTGDGTGKLTAIGGIPANGTASSDGTGQAIIADMNGDGKPDILAANFNDGFVGLLLHT
jgi:hypothetical protein